MALRSRPNESGQATVEYILLLSVLIGVFVSLNGWMRRTQLASKLAKPIQSEFAAAYRYGHPKAKGPDDPGGPAYHPRAVTGENSFRLFLNPGAR